MAKKKEIKEEIKEEIEEEIVEKIKEKKKEKTEKKEKKEKKYEPNSRKYGSRAEVWHGTAQMTTGGLHKSDLMKNKQGVLVSKKKSENAKKNDYLARLKK